MVSKKIAIPVGVIALVTTAGVAFAAYAYQGDPGTKGPNYSVERHAAMQQAFEKGDYNAWKDLMDGRGRVTQVINEGNFARFSEMHRLMLEGKYEDANKIRAELGLGAKNGEGKNGGGKGMRKGGGCKGGCQGNFVDGNNNGTCDNRE